jgi:hypothetical protein
MVMARSRIGELTNHKEQARSGLRLPHKHAKEEEKGEWANLPDLIEARRGRSYMQKVRVEQVLL